MKVSVVGCSLLDEIYANIDFSSKAFAKYASRNDGDGGLIPGKLVFSEDLVKFAHEDYEQILHAITDGVASSGRNLGGPAIVAAVHAAQLLAHENVQFRFFGAHGNDRHWQEIRSILAKTPVNIDHYQLMKGATPCSDVLSDPRHHNGKGERSFICTVGAALQYDKEQLKEEFFDADVLLFGATALLPALHDQLDVLLKKGRQKGCVNIVSTVFDFRNEQRDPVGRWPLGGSDESYRYIDLLVVDFDEACRLSGSDTPEKAVAFFAEKGVSSVVITHGANKFHVWSNGRFFAPCDFLSLPVSEKINEDLAAHPERRGDTTGCGDNFAGGMVASTVEQLLRGTKAGSLDLLESCAWAGASGGFACFCIGGTYIESAPGEKRAKVEHYFHEYFDALKKEFRRG